MLLLQPDLPLWTSSKLLHTKGASRETRLDFLVHPTQAPLLRAGIVGSRLSTLEIHAESYRQGLTQSLPRASKRPAMASSSGATHDTTNAAASSHQLGKRKADVGAAGQDKRLKRQWGLEVVSPQLVLV